MVRANLQPSYSTTSKIANPTSKITGTSPNISLKLLFQFRAQKSYRALFHSRCIQNSFATLKFADKYCICVGELKAQAMYQ